MECPECGHNDYHEDTCVGWWAERFGSLDDWQPIPGGGWEWLPGRKLPPDEHPNGYTIKAGPNLPAVQP